MGTEETEKTFKQFHVAQHWALLGGMDIGNGLDFDKQTPIDEQIKSEWILALELLAVGGNKVDEENRVNATMSSPLPPFPPVHLR